VPSVAVERVAGSRPAWSQLRWAARSISSSCASSWLGSWWKRDQSLRVGTRGEGDRVGHTTVAPPDMGWVLVVGVLGVVDEDRGAVG
jgi:hypothetical protein